MVKNCFKNFYNKNAFVVPAAFLAIVFYSGFFCFNNQNSYHALVPPRTVSRIYGKVVSTPQKLSGYKNAYRVNVLLDRVATKDGVLCNAGGVVQTFVPVSLYEIYFPGKLYSSWHGKKHGILIDSGAEIEFDVAPKTVNSKNKNAQTEFHVIAIKCCVWQKSFWKTVQKIRALSRLHFTRLMYAWGKAGGLVLALLSGSREYLADGIGDAFRNAGLSHILALSGMHLSLFSGLAFFLGKKSLGKKFAPFLEAVAVLLFFWFAGKSPSLFRALLCSFCAIIGSALHIKIRSMLNVLALCFLIHISIFPADMFEIGFMLSYGALAGILCFNEFLSKPLTRAIPYNVGNSLGQSTGAQVFNTPVCLKYFRIFVPFGIFASTIVSPMITVFIYMALVFIVLCLLLPFCVPVCGGVLGGIYFVLEKCVLFFSRFPQVKFD